MTEIRNHVSGVVAEKTLAEYLEMFDPEVRGQIENLIRRQDVGGAVAFVNLQLDSTQAGAMTSMIYGPGCTYKTLEDAVAIFLGDLPSQRQYPAAYYRKP